MYPDDESSKGAASTVRYVREGADVMVVSLTGGERGDILNPSFQAPAGMELIDVRRQEMAEAARILGVQHRWLGYVDSGFPEGDPPPPLPDDAFAVQPIEEPVERLVALIREFRPHVVTTYDENGGYPHPDHIRCHEVSIAAYHAAGDAEQFPEAGEPWRPAKLYYHVSFHRDRFVATNEAAERHGLEPPFTGERFAALLNGEWKTPEPTTFVECADYFAVRDDALRAHASQVDPDGRWFVLPLDVQAQAWPTEDFALAHSHVSTSLPEDDLFAGVAASGTEPA